LTPGTQIADSMDNGLALSPKQETSLDNSFRVFLLLVGIVIINLISFARNPCEIGWNPHACLDVVRRDTLIWSPSVDPTLYKAPRIVGLAVFARQHRSPDNSDCNGPCSSPLRDLIIGPEKYE